MKTLSGTGIALATPFKEDLSVDYAALEQLVEYNIQRQINYLVILGTTAEPATLSSSEKKEVINCIKSVNGKRLPLVIGIGGNNTAEVVANVQNTDLADYEAVLSVSPYYNRPSQEGIYQHFMAVAKASVKPVILYNVPSRTASNVDAATTLRLAQENPNIVALKEASPAFTQSMEILKNKPADFMVLSGDDEYGLPMTLAGGKGVISVIAQALPEYYAKMIDLGLNKQVDEAYDIFYKLLNITRAIYNEGSPTGIKSLLHIIGLTQPYTRLPLVPASQDLTRYLKQCYKELTAA